MGTDWIKVPKEFYDYHDKLIEPEIDQLRAELQDAKDNAEMYLQRAERFDCNFWEMKGRAESAEEDCANLRAENERLKQDNVFLADLINDAAKQSVKMREALERINSCLEHHPCGCGDIAREALNVP